MADRIPYKGRNLDVFATEDGWIVEITDTAGRTSMAKARTFESAINAAYQMIDSEDAAAANQ